MSIVSKFSFEEIGNFAINNVFFIYTHKKRTASVKKKFI